MNFTLAFLSLKRLIAVPSIEGINVMKSFPLRFCSLSGNPQQLMLVLRVFPSFIFALCLLANAGMKCSNFRITFLGEVWVSELFVLTQVIPTLSLFYKTWCRISLFVIFLFCISGWEVVAV